MFDILTARSWQSGKKAAQGMLYLRSAKEGRSVFWVRSVEQYITLRPCRRWVGWRDIIPPYIWKERRAQRVLSAVG